MTISEMTDDERHTFGALVRTMVGADGSTSLEESVDLQAAASRLGVDAFWGLMRETAGTDYPAEALRKRASGVERREVQETIYGVLFPVARLAGRDLEHHRVRPGSQSQLGHDNPAHLTSRTGHAASMPILWLRVPHSRPGWVGSAACEARAIRST